MERDRMEDGGCRMEEAAIRELKEYAGLAKDTMGQMLPQEPECQSASASATATGVSGKSPQAGLNNNFAIAPAMTKWMWMEARGWGGQAASWSRRCASPAVWLNECDIMLLRFGGEL